MGQKPFLGILFQNDSVDFSGEEVAQTFGSSFAKDSPLLKNEDPMTNGFDKPHVVGGNEDEGSLLLRGLKDPGAHLPCGFDIQPQGWLIQEHHRRFRDEGAGDSHLLLHSLGKEANLFMGDLGEAERIQQPSRPLPDLSGCQPPKSGEIEEVFPRGQPPIDVPCPF